MKDYRKNIIASERHTACRKVEEDKGSSPIGVTQLPEITLQQVTPMGFCE